LGHRRGVPADRLSTAGARRADRCVTTESVAVVENTTARVTTKKGTSTGGRKTTNRPVRATAHDPVSLGARSPDDSARTVRNSAQFLLN
jgi:hypothetical protein